MTAEGFVFPQPAGGGGDRCRQTSMPAQLWALRDDYSWQREGNEMPALWNSSARQNRSHISSTRSSHATTLSSWRANDQRNCAAAWLQPQCGAEHARVDHQWQWQHGAVRPSRIFRVGPVDAR